MSLDTEIQQALASRSDVSALACMDGDAGLVLGLFAKEDVARDAVELAVRAAPQLCAAPDWTADGDVERASQESVVVSDNWVHAFVRVPKRPSLVVVGLAKTDTSVALLRAWLREVAGRVGEAA